MNEIVHLLEGKETDDGGFVMTSQITLCCRRHVLDERVKLGTCDPNAVTCRADTEGGEPFSCIDLGHETTENCSHPDHRGADE